MKRILSIVSVAFLALLFVVPMAHAKKKKKAPYSIKETVSLSADADLVVTIDGELEPCGEWDCFLFITEPKKAPGADALLALRMSASGEYELRTPKDKEEGEDKAAEDEAGEGSEEKAEEKAEEDSEDGEDASEVMTLDDGTELKVKKLRENECDPIELAEYTEYSKKAAAEGKEAADDSWKKLPILSFEERYKCYRRKTPAKTYELDEFAEGDPMAKDEDEAKELKFDKADGTLAEADGARSLTIPAEMLPAGDFDLSVNGFWGATYEGHRVGSAARTGVVRIER